MRASDSVEELAPPLFVPGERWGWEYVEPGEARQSPALGRRPEWFEPGIADVSDILEKRARARYHLGRKIALVAFLALTGLGSLTSGGFIFVLGAAALGYYWFAPILTANQKMASLKAHADAERQDALARYETKLAEWQRKVARHDKAEAKRLAALDVFYPLELEGQPSRVDVFGGTARGWASLLATMGCSALGSGQRLVVLDFSDQDVTEPLRALAEGRGLGVQHHSLPSQLPELPLFAGLDADQLGELVADAVHAANDSCAATDLRSVGADLVRQVAESLDQPLDLPRLAAGLHVLQRTYDARDGVLSLDEEGRLAQRVDLIGQTDKTKDELNLLCRSVELLTRSLGDQEAGGIAAPALDPAVPLLVLETADGNSQRKGLTDAVVFHAVLHQLRERMPQLAQRTVVVVGADHLGKESLEALWKQTRRQGTRLVLFLENLRDDLQHLLGGGDSAALLMRLGNAQQAKEAAEYIGRGHTYVLGQITQGTGQTRTRGGGTSEGTSRTSSTTYGSNTGSSSSRSHSESESFSSSFQTSENWSQATSTNRGTTDTRVYEFQVEPTILQTLPQTSFVLVDSGASGRRVAWGDCDPRYSLAERVSAKPLSAATRPEYERRAVEQSGSDCAGSAEEDRPISAWKLADYSRQHGQVAEHIRRMGYAVQYVPDQRSPAMSGWQATRPDGRPLDQADMHRLQDTLQGYFGRS